MALAALRNGARPDSACSALLVTVLPQGDKKNKQQRPQQQQQQASYVLSKDSAIDLTSSVGLRDDDDLQQLHQHHQQQQKQPSVPTLKLPIKNNKQQHHQHNQQQQQKAVLPPIPLPSFLLDSTHSSAAANGAASGARLTLEELMQRHQDTKKIAVDASMERHVCCLCKAVYRERDNHDSACSWHPGKRCDT